MGDYFNKRPAAKYGATAVGSYLGGPLGGLAVNSETNEFDRFNSTEAYMKDKIWGGDPLSKKFWTSEGLKGWHNAATRNIVDPANIFGLFDGKSTIADKVSSWFGGGDSKKKKKKKKAMKEYESQLIGEGFDENQEDYLDQLLRTISTIGQQQGNRASEFAAYNDLSEASEAAMQRGVDYQTLLAGKEGGVDLSVRAEQQRANNIQFLMALKAEKNASKRQEMFSQWQAAGNTIGQLAQAAGYYYGSQSGTTTTS